MKPCTLANIGACDVEDCAECARILSTVRPLRFIRIKHAVGFKKHGWRLSWVFPGLVELGWLRGVLRKDREAMEKARRKRGQLR